MPKGHKPAPLADKASSQPADCREALQWFVNTVGLYQTSTRGLIVTDFGDEQEAALEQALMSLKSRGINPVVITGDALYRQGEFLWDQAVQHTRFGRPLASQFELDMTGADVLILKNVEAPETAHHLWYLYHHVLYPRALAGKPLLLTTPLGLDEFQKYGGECDDFEFAGRKLTWQKINWLMDATCIDLHLYRTLKDEGLPLMLRAEYQLFKAMKEREMAVQPQHILGDYMLDIAMVDRDRKLDIECDVLTSLDSTGANAWQAKKNLLLLNDGWRVLKFTVAEIASNINACVDVVEEVWTQGRKRSSVGRLLSGQATASVPELPVDDDVQRLVITHNAGPCAVEGGAGTGKTSCVIHRVAFLLAQGINPDRILVLSHSQDTVKTLKTAVEAIADRQMVQRVSFHSWHDLGLKILKENLGAVKRKPPLKVESNPQKVIQRLLTKHKKDLDPVTLELSEELDEFTIASLISLYKANLITPKHLKERAKSNVDELVCKVFQGYEDQLQKINRIDRDDMVSLAAHALVDNADLRTKYQNQYDYVLIDEFQDATAAGDLMARILAAPQDNLYLTGDEDEAIYESKGGLPRLMADVSIRMPNARCYILEKNWRCHPAIVDHTRQLTANLTRRRVMKDMMSGWGAAPTTAIIGPQFSETEEAEAEWVADEISILIDSGRNPQDIAVLYRYHRYGIIIDEALSRRNIRCVTSHPEAGLIPDEVGDVMAFLRLVMDPDGPKARESFERVCQLRVKEVDPKLSSTIASFAEANNLSYLKAVEIYSEAVAEQSCLDLSQLVRIIRTMHQDNLGPAQTISLLKRTQRLGDYYRAVKVPPGVNYEPLKKLVELEEEARNYKTVAEFVKAQTATPAKGAAGGFDTADHVVHILTLHEAKGKEFSVAFLVGLAEGLFPADSAMDLEEERRLCYVGMTRAKELLYLSYPSIFNNVGLQPSSFLIEARLMAQQPMHIPAPTLPAAAPQAVTQQAKPAVAPVQAPKPVEPAKPSAEQLAKAAQEAEAAKAAQAAAMAQQAEAEKVARAEEAAKAAESARLAQEAEAARAAQAAKLAQEAEELRAAQAEAARVAQEVEAARAAQAAAAKAAQEARAAQALKELQEAEAARAAQAAAAKAAQEAEAARLAQAAEIAKIAREAEEARLAQEEEKARQVKEAEAARQAQFAAARAAQEALAQEAEALRAAELAKAAQAAAAQAAHDAGSQATTIGAAAASYHDAFQKQLLDKHANEQKEIAKAVSAGDMINQEHAPQDVAAARPPRPGRRGRQAEPVASVDSEADMGPVQAALQRRNKAKQEAAAAAAASADEETSLEEQSKVQSIPAPVAAVSESYEPPQQEEPPQQQSPLSQQSEQAESPHQLQQPQQHLQPQVEQFAPAFDGAVRADLSIAHDQFAAEQVSRYKGAGPVSKRRIATNQPQPADSTPTEAAASATPDVLEQLITQQPALPSPLSSLTEDVPPGVVIHNGPVSKGKSKPPIPKSILHEDPNHPPGAYAIPNSTELGAANNFDQAPNTLPESDRPTAGIFAEQQVYMPMSPQERQDAEVRAELPPPLDPEFEDSLAPEPPKQPSAKPPLYPGAAKKRQLLHDDDLEDLLGPAAAQPQPQSRESRYTPAPVENTTGYQSPEVEEYNYTAPHDPAYMQQQDEHDFDHLPRCPGCDTFLEAGSQFCGECGYRQEVRIPGCHLCGSPLEPSAKFCGECGSKRSGMPKPAPLPQRVPDRQSEEYEAYLAQAAQKPTQRSWVVKLLKMLET